MEEYNFHYKYWRPAVTTDCVIFGFTGTKMNVLLICRGEEPFKGKWALPGGFLRENDKSVEDCARRELKEETDLDQNYIEQFGCYSAIDRDPRERVVTIAFFALTYISDVKGGDDAADAKWFPIDDLPELAFDHETILHDALKHLRESIHFRPIGYELLPETFTMPMLQNLYECILGVKFDRRNFAKKILHLGIVKYEGFSYYYGSRKVQTYSFDREKYDEMKNNGLQFEFDGVIRKRKK